MLDYVTDGQYHFCVCLVNVNMLKARRITNDSPAVCGEAGDAPHKKKARYDGSNSAPPLL